MHITLVGMSNIGKSHWAHRRLKVELGYTWIDCDKLIETKLASELSQHGYHGIHDVAAWMGQPYDPQYPETSHKYLDCEREVMLETLEMMKKTSMPLVIDTTGSVIYLEQKILDQIKSMTKVVYLQESQSHIEKLFELYITNPKPVIWGSSFIPNMDEFPSDSLKRCYPELLNFRATRYKAFSHIQIPYHHHRAAEATWQQLMTQANNPVA